MNKLSTLLSVLLILNSCTDPDSKKPNQPGPFAANDPIGRQIEKLTVQNADSHPNITDNSNSFTATQPKKVNLTDAMVKSYIRFSKELYNKENDLLHKIQSLVPLDLTQYKDLMIKSGFSDIDQFADANLVIGVCVNSILAAEHTDQLQGKTKDEYIADFIKDLDPNDPIDQKVIESIKKQLDESLGELETKGVVGNKTTQMRRFVIKDLEEKKVGKENMNVILQNLDELKDYWVYKFEVSLD